MKQNHKTLFVLFGGTAIVIFFVITNWIVTAIRQESSAVRASIEKATDELPFSNLKEELEKQLSEMKDLSGKVLDEAGRDPSEQESPRTLLGEAFRTGHRLSRSMDKLGQELLQLRPEEVEAMGQQVHTELRRQLRIVGNEQDRARLRRLAQPFLANENPASSDIRFHIVEESQVNAFAHIGGHVYVTTALLRFVRNDEELRFVLGHEIAHVRLGHCTAQMTYAAHAAKLTGELGQHVTLLAYSAIAVGYSEDHEFAADAWSCEQAPECRGSAVAFLGRLSNLYPKTDSPGETASKDPPDEAPELLGELNKHFRTHPETDERVKRLSSR